MIRKHHKDHGDTIPSKISQVNIYLNRWCKFIGRNGEIYTCPMVENCNRKLPGEIDVRLNCNFKANEIYSYAPATASQPTSPPSGGSSFIYRGGGVGLKSYKSSSRVSSKSSRPLWCFFVSMNFAVLGVYMGRATS
jgi:hypothetical protein